MTLLTALHDRTGRLEKNAIEKAGQLRLHDRTGRLENSIDS